MRVVKLCIFPVAIFAAGTSTRGVPDDSFELRNDQQCAGDMHATIEL
jgi:hypothetical protein